MATAASISNSSTWMPEDDVLLKNAMQEGASFEALVKGVVPFSRRFTFQELRDRWHSLLYDSDIAAQASVSMFQLELSGFNPVLKIEQPRSFNFKESLGKRNSGSVRQHYYTVRKKFRRDFFNPTDFSLLEEANLHDISGSKANFQDHKEQSHGGKCMLNGIQDHFELLQEADIEILHHAFPKHMNVSVTQDATATHMSYLTECSNRAEDKSSNELIRKDGFPDDISTSLSKDIGIFEPSREPSGVSRFMKSNSVEFDEAGSVEHQQLSSEGKHFQRLNVQPLSGFGSTKADCSNGFLGQQQGDPLNSPIGNSFHALGFPSPQPSLPLWEPVDEFSVAQMPEKLKHVDAAPGSGDCMVKDSLVYNVVHTGPLLDVSHDGPALESNSPVVAEGEDISDSLLNFSNEDDLLLFDVDKKEIFQKSSSGNQNSLLMSYPIDIPEDGAYKLESEIMVSESSPVDHSSASSKMLGAHAPFTYAECQNLYESAVKGSSRSVSKVDHHAVSDGNICCVLNTEDPEIPCNDDIFLLIHPSTSFATSSAAPPQPMSRDSLDVSSAAKPKHCVQGINLVTKGKDIAKGSAWPQKVVTSVRTEAHSVKPVRFGVKSDCPDTAPPALPTLPGDARQIFAEPAQSRSLLTNPSISISRVLNEDLSRVDLKAGDALAAFFEPQSAETGAVKIPFPDPTIEPSTSDNEESQSDDDVPNYSDIEAMILEMDLVPFDLDINTTKQVTRYQHENTNRTIIRLEQCSQSSLQRTMARQGAFAVLYGRHLRHYIRKTEVLLGRSTDDVDVDVDLRMEGCANKISRRQAIIKMEDGSFFLKNLGKGVIFVNGKCIATGQLFALSTSSLIEIRGMSFVFEINHKYVSRYTSALSQGSNGRLSKFEWSQEHCM